MPGIENMNKAPNWYVVSGGPSSGKTTLVNEMAKLGYATYPEATRFLIEKEMAQGRKLEEIQNTLELQEKVLQLQLKNEENAPKDRIVFFDRAIPDGLAYTRFNKLSEAMFSGLELRGRYKKIFFCQPLPFEKDRVRIEDKKWANALSRVVRQIYADLGYDIIDLAPTPNVSDRVKVVLKELSRLR
jgi:predicted ATPase